MRLFLGTILLLGFIGSMLWKMVKCIDGFYKDHEQQTSRARKLFRHGLIRKVK